LTHFQGQTWNGPDEVAYEMIEASPEISAELDAEEADRYDLPTARDGNQYRSGDKYYGFEPDKWYRLGDLLDFDAANPALSAEEFMAQAIEVAEEFWDWEKQEIEMIH